MQRHRTARWALHAAIALLAPIGLARAAVTYHAIATSGDPVPNVPDRTFSAFGFDSPDVFFSTEVRINNTGQIAFTALHAGRGITASNDTALWLASSGSLRPIAYEGQRPPGSERGTKMGNMYGLSLNDSGQVAFVAGTALKKTSGLGIWTGKPRSLQLVAHGPSQATPSTPRYYLESLNSSGTIVINKGEYRDERYLNHTILAGKPGALKTVAGHGAPAPGLRKRTFDDVHRFPLINDVGQVAFFGDVGTSTNQVNGIWLGQPGQVRPVVHTGMSDPATQTRFTTISNDFSLNNRGQVAYRTSANASHRWDALWLSGPQSSSLIARTGQQAPGTAKTFGFLDDTPAINDAGQFAFTARLEGDQDGIWIGSGNSLRLLALGGTPAPETPNTFSWIHGADINDAGQVLFVAVTHNPRTGKSSSGLWTTDTAGDVHPIVQEGGRIRVDGAWHRIRDLGDYDFNDLGQLAFAASFTDGSSGVFLADTSRLTPASHSAPTFSAYTIVPEPSTLLLLAFPACLLRRRQKLQSQ